MIYEWDGAWKFEDTTRWIDGAGGFGPFSGVLLVAISARLLWWGMVGRFVSGLRAVGSADYRWVQEHIPMGLSDF